MLAAHQQLLKQFPDLLLILVPRHPERFAKAEELTQKAGLKFIRRSEGIVPTPDIQVVVGDTMGS